MSVDMEGFWPRRFSFHSSTTPNAYPARMCVAPKKSVHPTVDPDGTHTNSTRQGVAEEAYCVRIGPSALEKPIGRSQSKFLHAVRSFLPISPSRNVKINLTDAYRSLAALHRSSESCTLNHLMVKRKKNTNETSGALFNIHLFIIGVVNYHPAQPVQWQKSQDKDL